MNYQEALAYIYSFTDYERNGKYTRDRNENLVRITALLELLDNPHQKYSNTLIAGTKGKGSTAATIESVLRAAGVRTGLYTQPDLHTFRERARVNGHLISEDEVGLLVPRIQAAVEALQSKGTLEPFITYEIGTALAFLFFAYSHVQHAVVEVGLGGRLDATNITHPLASVITSISYDHMNILGDTLAKIATEKAGIIKQDGIIVTSAQSPEALLAIATVARSRNARMIRIGSAAVDPAEEEVAAGNLPALSYRYQAQQQSELGQHFTITTPTGAYTNLVTPLLGTHQLENATAALATLEQLRERGIDWNEDALRRGMASVHWPARMQIVGHSPMIVVDGAHNADSMQKLLLTLHSTFTARHLIFVLGVNRDKDLARMMKVLTNIDCVVLTRANNPRASHTEDLENLFKEYAPQVKVYCEEDSNAALDLARSLAQPDDLICATGSLYLAAEALRWAAAHGDRQAASEIEGVDH